MKRSQQVFLFVTGILALLILTNCEKEIILDIPPPEPKIVVEARIETNGQPTVVLNRNFPYFGQITATQYAANYVHNAVVVVSDGEKQVTLPEICWSKLSDFEQELLAKQFGITIDSLPSGFDLCVYAEFSPNPTLKGENGKTYTLNIYTQEGDTLTSLTTIPYPVAIDSFWLEKHKDPKYADSLRRVLIQFKDPDTLGNYYRLFTNYNNQGYLTNFSSVSDDLFINGKSFFFPANKAEARNSSDEIDPDTFGYCKIGDTLKVKFCTIDYANYLFLNTLEYSANSNGPMGAPVNIKHNVKNGLGTFTGYCVGSEIDVYIDK